MTPNRTTQRLIKLAMILLDLITVALTFSACVLTRKGLGGTLSPAAYFSLYPFLLIFWLVFEKAGLYQGSAVYSGASIGPVDEFRRIFYSLSGIFIALGFANYCYRPSDYLYSRSVFTATWIACLILIPAHRLLLRKLCIRAGIWGVPAIMIGSGKTAQKVSEQLLSHPEYGVRPIGFFCDCAREANAEIALPDLGALSALPAFAKKQSIQYAILTQNTPPYDTIDHIVKRYGALFPHVLFISDLSLESTSWITPKDLGGILGLEVRHNLQIPHIRWTKRCLDFLLTLPCLLIGSLAMLLIAIAIKLDSPGPIFYCHQRVGKNRAPLIIYKFRTMFCHAEDQLQALLSEQPERRAEWETYGKLENDPRITRIGRWLRATSLDELPQLFNVLQGRIALVGPRPVVEEELAHYGEHQDLFDRVTPGLTGLWQVSGRNHLTYADRVRLDNYYTNNWSVWLDLYILSKTIFAVLLRHGAQ